MLPMLLVVIWIVFSGKADILLKHTPPAWLLHMQVFRIPVEFLIWFLFLSGKLPEQMTFEGRNFDILAGISGPVIGLFAFGNGKHLKWLALAWNFISLALLINIVTIAILSLPTPFQVFMNAPGSAIAMELPFIFLPGILVVMAYTLHCLSIRQLAKGLSH